jgi:hypothetical protein
MVEQSLANHTFWVLIAEISGSWSITLSIGDAFWLRKLVSFRWK